MYLVRSPNSFKNTKKQGITSTNTKKSIKKKKKVLIMKLLSSSKI